MIMEPNMIIYPHILLKIGDTIRIPQPQGEDILGTVLSIEGGILKLQVEGRAYIFHGGFFVLNEDGSYLPYQMD